MTKILVVGTGAWATALTNVLLENKHNVAMYGIDLNEINDIQNKKNTKYFQNITLIKKPNLVSNNLKKIFKVKYDVIVFAVPSVVVCSVAKQLINYISNKPIFINCSKGLNYLTKQPLSVELSKILKTRNLVSLTGPTFAKNVMQKAITVLNVACQNKSILKTVENIFNNNYFVVLPSKNELGLQYLGAMKNVMAIVFGLLQGLNVSPNTISGLFALAIREMSMILKTQVGNDRAMGDVGGIGDIYLTCCHSESRNFQFGLSLAKLGPQKALASVTQTTEGLVALDIVKEIVDQKKLHCPLIICIYDLIRNNKKPSTFVSNVIKELKK